MAVVSGSIRDHVQRHPRPHEVALVVEVANSSLSLDRAKATIYARANIPAYWIINLVEGRGECYEDPTGPIAAPHYRRQTQATAGDQIPLVIAGQTLPSISVGELLP